MVWRTRGYLSWCQQKVKHRSQQCTALFPIHQCYSFHSLFCDSLWALGRERVGQMIYPELSPHIYHTWQFNQLPMSASTTACFEKIFFNITLVKIPTWGGEAFPLRPIFVGLRVGPCRQGRDSPLGTWLQEDCPYLDIGSANWIEDPFNQLSQQQKEEHEIGRKLLWMVQRRWIWPKYIV